MRNYFEAYIVGALDSSRIKTQKDAPKPTPANELSECLKDLSRLSLDKQNVENALANAPTDRGILQKQKRLGEKIAKHEIALLQTLLQNEVFRMKFSCEVKQYFSRLNGLGAKLLLEAATIVALLQMNPGFSVKLPNICTRRERKISFLLVKDDQVIPILFHKSVQEGYFVFPGDQKILNYPASPYKALTLEQKYLDKYRIAQEQSEKCGWDSPIFIGVPFSLIARDNGKLGLVGNQDARK